MAGKINIPGVYSKIDASAAVSALSPNETVIGIVAQADKGDDNVPFAPSSFERAVEEYGEDSPIIELMRVAMINGGNKFILTKVGVDEFNEPDYDSAFEAMELEEAVRIIITDSMDELQHKKIKDHNIAASENRRERFAILGFPKGTAIEEAAIRAEDINSGRIIYSYPNVLDEAGEELDGIYNAAALAGRIAAEDDPARPMTNVDIRGFFGLAKKLKDSELNFLIEAGISPLEVRNGTIRIVRCITSYTKDETGTADITWQEITTVRISDYIFNDLRDRLTKKYSRAKQNQRTRDSIKSDVLTALQSYEALEYLQNVEIDDVSIRINEFDPTRSDVIFKYQVVTPLNVIFLTGHLVI